MHNKCMGLYGNLTIIRFKKRRIQKLLCVSQRRLQDVYSVSVQDLTVYELDGKRPKEIYSIYRKIHCFNLYTLFLICQVNKNVLVLLINIVLPLAIRTL